MGRFLVVLANRADYLRNSPNTHYRGVNRVAPYSPYIDEDRAALEAYVFGPYKDDNNLIPTEDVAKELLRQFAGSKKQLEIIYCEVLDEERGIVSMPHFRFGGYDVAALEGGYWSIVGDFPAAQTMRKYLSILNDVGLFDDHKTAQVFLNDYCNKKLPDYDSPMSIVRVYLPV